MKKILFLLATLLSGVNNTEAQNKSYHFNGNVNNQLSNGNDGIISGTVNYITDRFGIPNAAIEMTGNGSKVNFGQIASINGQSNFTISGWFVKPASTVTTERVMFSVGTQILSKCINNSTIPQVHAFNACTTPMASSNTSTTLNIPKFSTLPASAWFHFAYVLNNGVIKTYINGKIYGESALVGPACAGAIDFVLGEHNGTAVANNWQGGIDDILIIGSALNVNQIDSLKNLPNVCESNINITQQPSNNILSTPSPVIFECFSSNAGASYQWQISRNGGVTFNDLANNATYQDVTTSSMIVEAADSMHAFQFRLKISEGICQRYSEVAKLLFSTSRHWKFDGNLLSNSGSNALVFSGGGNPATYISDRFGNPNKAFQLSASAVPTISSLTANGMSFLANAPEFSFSGWYWTSNGDNYFTSTNASSTWGTVGGVTAPIANMGGTTNTHSLNQNPFLSGIKWHHFTLNYQGGISKMYINGVLASTSVSSNFITPSNFSTFYIMNKFLFGSSYSSVLIDDLYLTNYLLSQNQIDSLVNAPNECALAIPITAHPLSVTLTDNGNTSFSCQTSATGINYQWQVSTNFGTSFTNLTNNATYSNVNTATLNIAATSTLQGNKYRCILSNGAGCTGRSSDTVSLFIIPTYEAIAYSFNNSTTVNDLGSNNNGVIQGGVTLTADRFGNAGKAYKINANGARINCGNIQMMNNAPQLSINGWFQKQNNTQKYLFSKGGNILFAKGTMSSSLNNSTQPILTQAGTDLFNSIAEGSWMMFTAIFDRGHYSIYINGIEVASIQNATTLTVSSINDFMIGGHETIIAPDPSLNNAVDDIFIVNRALSVAQIDSLLNQNPCGLTFNQHPNNKILAVDNTVIFSGSSSSANATYQWQASSDNGNTFTNLANNSVYAGVTTTHLSVHATMSLDKTLYRLNAISGTCNASSNHAMLSYPQAVAYSFNDMTTLNQLGSNNPGIGSGTNFMTDRFGNPNKALNIGGANNNLNIGTLAFLGNVNSFSFTGWFQKNSTFGVGQIFTAVTASGVPASDYLRGFMYNDNSAASALVYGNCQNGSTALTATTDPFTTINTNEWFHYSYVYNKPTLSIYINGVLYANVTPSVTPSGLAAGLANGTFYVGSYPGVSQSWQKGVDDIYITSKALTPQEIDSLIHLPNPCPPTMVNVTPIEFNEICNGASVKLSVLNQGAVYNWYDNLSSTTSLHTGSDFTTPALFANTTYFVEATCPNCTTIGPRLPILLEVKPILSAPNDITPSTNKLICPGKSTKLVAVSTGNSISWWDAASGGNHIGDGDTLNTPIIYTNTSYYASSVSGLCEGTTRTQIEVVVDPTIHPIISLLPFSCPTNILGSSYRFPVKVASEGTISIGSYVKETQHGDTASFMIAPNTAFVITSNEDGCIATLASTTPAFTPNGVAVATNSCQSCAIRDNKNYTMYDINTSQKLVGINDPSNSLSLGNIDVCVNVGLPFTIGGTHYLGRNFHLTPDSSSNATIRLFFTPSEFTALQNLDATASLAAIYVVAFDGLAETPSQFSSYNTYGPFTAITDVAGNYYIDVNVTNFSGFYITSALATPLPLNILHFDAQLINDEVSIRWVATNESTTNYYTVEKSKNAINFTALQDVKCNEHSTGVSSYVSIDNKPYEGDSYYRLKQVEKNGQIFYANIKKIIRPDQTEIFIYPNPCTMSLTISINNENECSLIEIYSLDGRKLITEQTCNLNHTVNVESLTKGTYFLRVSNSEKTYTTKFVRQ